MHVYSLAGGHCILYTLCSFDHLVPETILFIKDRIFDPRLLKLTNLRSRAEVIALMQRKTFPG